MQEHIAEFTGVNEDFETIFNAAGVGDMNRAMVSIDNLRPLHLTDEG